MPARNFSKTILYKAQNAITTDISTNNVVRIEQYLSFVLEQEFKLQKLANHLDKDVFKYSNTNEYSSYNAATGEEVLTKIIIDVVEAPNQSLILIDEIEVGLHPKIQRRLIQALYNIARYDNKQFIITTHSPSILQSVSDNARIFIEKTSDTIFKVIPNISVNASLSKMDSISYPLFDLYCEDNEAKKIILKAISSLQKEFNLVNFLDLVNIITSGSANSTYTYYKSHLETYPYKRIKTGYACVLDGDKRNSKDNKQNLQYPPSECLHFIFSEESPEKFLVQEYLKKHPNTSLSYHLHDSNNHSLFGKMVENSICTTKDEAFEICWEQFVNTDEGKAYLQTLKSFLISTAKKFSPDL